MPNQPPLPVTRAILLADSIIAEAGTHKKSLIGIYSRIAAPQLPFRRVLHVYAQLADAWGEYTFSIELVNLSTNEPVHRGEMGPVVAHDRLVPLEIVLHVPCIFEVYGEYELRLACSGNVFASRTVSVLPPPEPAQGRSDPGASAADN